MKLRPKRTIAIVCVVFVTVSSVLFINLARRYHSGRFKEPETVVLNFTTKGQGEYELTSSNNSQLARTRSGRLGGDLYGLMLTGTVWQGEHINLLVNDRTHDVVAFVSSKRRIIISVAFTPEGLNRSNGHITIKHDGNLRDGMNENKVYFRKGLEGGGDKGIRVRVPGRSQR